MINKILNVITGEPLTNEQSAGEKYNIPFGLAIMASDAVSSVAYAAQEILFVLIVLGVAAYQWLTITSFMIIGLLIILTIAYIQIIRAYPQGGGAYKVARENLGVFPGLTAGAGLIIGYILTVAVSACAGADAILSAFPFLTGAKVEIVVGIVIVLTILNLRGISESSKIFAIPTYIFIFSMLVMIGFGLFKYFVLHIQPEPEFEIPSQTMENVTFFMILRAFSSGCSALTGLESVSNSVPNFKEDSQKNAKTVMVLLAILIFVIFGGTSILTIFYQAVPKTEGPTVISQIAAAIFGKGFMFYLIQFSTAVILLMACNTSYTGFPMLMSIMGKDGYAPRQFTIRGKRLSFSFGIIALSCVACLLVLLFQANTHSLIPLYAIGVFTSFTLGQFGMVSHWMKSRDKGWRKSVLINGIGAVVTLLATAIILVQKFTEGAFIVVILIPIIVFVALKIKWHYKKVAVGLSISEIDLSKVNLRKKYEHIVIVPIASLNKATLGALEYAQSIGGLVFALNVSPDLESMEKLKKRWAELDTDIMLIAKYSPYRAVVTPLLNYISLIAASTEEGERVTVIVPQFMTDERWGNILHNHTGFFIRETLLKNDKVIVATYPYHLTDEAKESWSSEKPDAPGKS
ncbi:MAG: amino acid permease [Oscillospiraceae bacterium]|nr:amino acid permease [Oscillospiraceae bacterium]